jgi:hypothetical protein
MKPIGITSVLVAVTFSLATRTYSASQKPSDEPGGTVAMGGAFTQQLQFGNRATLTVSWGDSDNDGDLDLAVANNAGGNQLYTNNGDGTFTGQNQFGATGPFAPATFALAWGDYDNDGDLDMASGKSGQNQLHVNNGNGTFTNQNQFGAPTTSTVTMAWADFDLDGDIDLAVGNGILGSNQQNHLYVNNANGTFTQRAEFGINQTQTMSWADFDKDGDPDLAVGNGGFGTNQSNFLYVNNGDGTFTSREEFGSGINAADTTSLQWGDYDNDGDLDMAVGNWNNTQSQFYVNNGDGTFSAHPEFGARDTNAVAWGDYNHDGRLDLSVANGDFQNAEQNYLYINNGDGSFSEVAEFGLGSTDAVAWGDFDNDGDLDVAAGQEHSPPDNELYINNVDDNASLRLHLVGHFHDRGAGYSNRDGIGAKISVYTFGRLGDPEQLLGYREIEAHSGFSPQNAIDAHFGLTGHSKVDVRIAWPGSGGSSIVQDLRGTEVGQRLVIHEGPTVPATSTWGLVVLVLAMLSLGTAMQIRRASQN